MLQVISTQEAKSLLQTRLHPVEGSEICPLSQSTGRVLSEAVYAQEDLPKQARTMVDGYALRAQDTFGATEAIPAMLPLDGEILMGQAPQHPLQPHTCQKISTGGFLPAGADAAVMVEYTDTLPDGTVCIKKSVSPGTHVVFPGDDMQAGACIFDAGFCLNAPAIGALSALGVTSVCVRRAVHIGLFSTGDELVEPQTTPALGQMRDVNRAVLKADMAAHGAVVTDYGIVPDRLDALEDTLLTASKTCDFVVFSGSTSAGTRDFGAQVLEQHGEILWHGLAVKPGKPTLAAMLDGKLVLALPGHPAAAYLIWQTLGLTALKALQGQAFAPKTVCARLCAPVASNDGRELLLPVQLKAEQALPIHTKSGLIQAIAKADGYVRIPRNCEGLHAGTAVQVILFSTHTERTNPWDLPI